MERRAFSAGLAASGLAGLVGSPLAWAQAAPVEGKDYVKLATPAPVPATGKIDVVEFFWYGCPHCNALEPFLEAWIRKLPPEVAFRRVPACFNALYETHATMFYALEQTGQLEAMHRKIFAAIHQQHERLDKIEDMTAFVNKSGGDGAKFAEAFKSFGVSTKVRQGKQLSAAYKIDGVPTLGIHGRWFTGPGLAGGPDKALLVANQLIQRAQKAG